MHAGGKRFRPLFTLVAAGIGPRPDADEVVTAAAVTELIHLATLYHDDVMDEAELRRGAKSANARWDNSIAILTGDFLFAHASRLVAGLGPDAVRIIAETFAELVTGQTRETVGRRPDDDPIDHHLRVLDEKTASLIDTCARYAGIFSGAPEEHVLALRRRYGRAVGVAFQISDDIIDICSTDSGKTQAPTCGRRADALGALHARRPGRRSSAARTRRRTDPRRRPTWPRRSRCWPPRRAWPGHARRWPAMRTRPPPSCGCCPTRRPRTPWRPWSVTSSTAPADGPGFGHPSRRTVPGPPGSARRPRQAMVAVQPKSLPGGAGPGHVLAPPSQGRGSAGQRVGQAGEGVSALRVVVPPFGNEGVSSAKVSMLAAVRAARSCAAPSRPTSRRVRRGSPRRRRLRGAGDLRLPNWVCAADRRPSRHRGSAASARRWSARSRRRWPPIPVARRCSARPDSSPRAALSGSAGNRSGVDGRDHGADAGLVGQGAGGEAARPGPICRFRHESAGPSRRAATGENQITAPRARCPAVDYAPSFGRGPFGKVIGTSVNDAVLHGLPRDYRLADGDLLDLRLDFAVGPATAGRADASPKGFVAGGPVVMAGVGSAGCPRHHRRVVLGRRERPDLRGQQGLVNGVGMRPVSILRKVPKCRHRAGTVRAPPVVVHRVRRARRRADHLRIEYRDSYTERSDGVECAGAQARQDGHAAGHRFVRVMRSCGNG